MCAHGGTSDPVSRCIIRSKCTGNDVIGHRKSRDVLISQSNVCLSLVGPIKGHVWGNKARVIILIWMLRQALPIKVVLHGFETKCPFQSTKITCKIRPTTSK